MLTSWAAERQLFAVQRATSPGDTPIWRWQFQGDYPTYNQAVSLYPEHVIVVGLKNSLACSVYSYQPLNPSLGGTATVVPGLAYFLRHYQLGGGYTPGPVYLLAVLAGLIGSLGVARRGTGPAQRPGPPRPACCSSPPRELVLLASDIFKFSWRYQLPALVTLPPAGALGIAVIMGEVKRRKNGQASQDSTGQVPELGHAEPLTPPAAGAWPVPAVARPPRTLLISPAPLCTATALLASRPCWSSRPYVTRGPP